ncbi:MAG: dockerin type I repeat-containing protein [Ruminococcus sp.]|nr:dockerin type I repeat-containing protein [Ruminococcus sp.]
MYKKRGNIMGRISALTLGIMLAASCLTGFAEAASVSGDVNSDGKTDVTDIAVTAAHIKGIKALDKEAAARADVNGDGSINVADIANLAAHIKGIKALSENQTEPVRELKLGDKVSLIGGSHGKLVTMAGKVEGGMTGKFSAEYKVTDALSGKTELDFTSENSYNFAGLKKDGTLMLTRLVPEGGYEIYSYVPGKDKPSVIKLDNDVYRTYFDEQTDSLYIEEETKLNRLTADGKLEEIVSFGEDKLLTGVDASGMTAALQGDAISKDLSKVSVISLADGKSLWETVSHDGGGIVFTQHNAVAYDNIIKDDKSVGALRCFDAKTGKKLGVYQPEGDVAKVYSSSMTDNCILQNSDSDDFVTVFNSTTGETAAVDLGIKDMRLNGAYCIDENTWAVNLSTGLGMDSVSKTFIIRTDKLEFKKLPTGQDIETYEEFQLKTCGEALKAQREKADELEDKYGVTILIGDEVLNIELLGCGFSSTEQDMDEGYPEELDQTLDELDDWMSAYPEGFFEKFKTPENKNGYRILAVNDFYDNASNPIEMAGVTYELKDYINVAFMRYQADFKSVMDHETWHAVEHLVNKKYVFDEEAWDKLNPDDFKYMTGNYFAGDETDKKYEKYCVGLMDRNKNYDAYFIEEYSLTNSKEDRATLIGFMYPSSTQSGNYTMDEEIEKYPHLKAKLDYLGEWSKQYFGYVYWDEMIKNKYVPAPGEALG